MRESIPPDGRVAKWILLFTLLLALLVRLAGGGETAAPGPQDDLYAKVRRASVEVLVQGRLEGTGWFVDSKGLIFTAAHVLAEPGRDIEVCSPVAGRIDAELLAVDLGHDLALLQVEPRKDGYPALELADKLPPPGSEVFVLGTPLFRRGVMMRGTVGRPEPTFEYYNFGYVQVLTIAADTPGGMSGGPWFTPCGKVVGLQSSSMSLNNVPVGVTFVAPADAIRTLLKNNRNAATPGIGLHVAEIWQQQREFTSRFPPKTEGLVVHALKKDGPADRSGIKQGNLIIAADGRKVALVDELIGAVRGKPPGSAIKLTLLGADGTGSYEVSVPIGRLEVGWPDRAETEQ